MPQNNLVQNNQKTCVVFLQMGGAKNKEEVKTFLINLFSDPEIIRLPIFLKPFQKLLAQIITKTRIKGTIKMYDEIGGGSPILEITQSFSKKVEQNLIEKGYNVETFIIMRYSQPRAKDTIEKIEKAKCKKIVLFTLYPHYSNATTGSSIKDFFKHINGRLKELEIIQIREWGLEDTYINWWVSQLKATIEKIPAKQRKETHILFSAHSLPKKYVEKGDPYLKQIQTSYQRVTDKIKKEYPEIKTSLSFQSKVGPVEWLKPYTEEKIKEIAKQNPKHLIIVPFGFVSDHLETIYEIDVYYKNISKESGIPNFYRIKTPNDNPTFVEGISKIIEKRVKSNE